MASMDGLGERRLLSDGPVAGPGESVTGANEKQPTIQQHSPGKDLIRTRVVHLLLILSLPLSVCLYPSRKYTQTLERSL